METPDLYLLLTLKTKLLLINEYNLRGAGYWQLMKLFRANWLQVQTMYDVVKKIENLYSE